MKNNLKIEALDTLFFKDGKPFSMGEESWAEGVFPPYPSVVSGALRSVCFAQDMSKFQFATQIGKDPTLKLTIEGYLPCLDNGAAFPAPFDLYGLKEDTKQQAWPFKPQSIPGNIISEYELTHFFESQHAGKLETLGGSALLAEDHFRKYLNGETSGLEYQMLSHYLSKEPKIGIGRDPGTRTASEGKLYRLNMNRLEGENGKKLGFLIKTSGIEFPKQGLMRMGAEAKAAEYQTAQFPDIPCPVTTEMKEFKLYLATPAIFEEGPVPLKWLKEHGLELIACANGRPSHIGGFDMEKRRPKPMRKAVPAGTVYYLAAPNGITEELLAQLHQGSVYNLAPAHDTSDAADLRRQGFGLTYLGKK